MAAILPAHPNRNSTSLGCPVVPLPVKFNSLPILSRQQIATRITQGELLVIHYPLVYKIPITWLNRHPGGELAILHFVGRDAGLEIEGYHTGMTVLKRMGVYTVGKIEGDGMGGNGNWRDLVPPVQMGLWPVPIPSITVTEHVGGDSEGEKLEREKISTKLKTKELSIEMMDPILPSEGLPVNFEYQAHIKQSFRKLHLKFHELDLLKPPPFLSGYGPSLLIYFSLFALFGHFYIQQQFLVSAIFLGAFWHQITFVAHDAGHTAITGKWMTDRIIGILVGDALGGISVGWWCDNHNVHHLVTNSPEHDPDIQHLPFFAITNKFFDSITSTYYKRVLIFDKFTQAVLPYQHNLYYPILLFARFNLFANSYSFLWNARPHKSSPLYKLRIFEFVSIAFFWTWFGLLVRGVPGIGMKVAFVLISFAVTAPLHVQIVLSHFSQAVDLSPSSAIPTKLHPAIELLESFPHRQLRTTMDIATPSYLAFLHGGLNSQVPHHLFPRLPRFNFRKATKVLEAWVQEENRLVEQGTWSEKGGVLGSTEGLDYRKMEFVEANRDVLGVLKEVGRQCWVLGLAAEKEGKELFGN